MNEFPSKNHPETCLKWGSKGVGGGGGYNPLQGLFVPLKISMEVANWCACKNR